MRNVWIGLCAIAITSLSGCAHKKAPAPVEPAAIVAPVEAAPVAEPAPAAAPVVEAPPPAAPPPECAAAADCASKGAAAAGMAWDCKEGKCAQDKVVVGAPPAKKVAKKKGK